MWSPPDGVTHGCHRHWPPWSASSYLWGHVCCMSNMAHSNMCDLQHVWCSQHRPLTQFNLVVLPPPEVERQLDNVIDLRSTVGNFQSKKSSDRRIWKTGHLQEEPLGLLRLCKHLCPSQSIFCKLGWNFLRMISSEIVGRFCSFWYWNTCFIQHILYCTHESMVETL